MDNAKYHKAMQDGTPAIKDLKMKDGSAAAYMRANNLQLQPLRPGQKRYYRDDYIQVIRGHIASAVPLEVEYQAALHGHRILFTPPYQSDLEPIELVWASVKRKVAIQYDSSMCGTLH